MNVVITIKGREAIPVRAIPYLTDWEVMSPDVVADALTGEDEFNPQFKELRAYRFDDDTIKVVNPNWWANFPARELKALSDRIGQSEISHETGYDDWRRDSLKLLPAGVFVWRDEFETCFWRRFGPEGETVFVITPGGEFGRRRRAESIELDYNPFIPAKERCELVMEGFAGQSRLTDTNAVSVVTNGKRWTAEKLEELKAYRDAHTMPETANKFGITEQRIRQLLPRKKPKPTPFSGLIHRTK